MPRPREDGDERVLWPLRCQLSLSPLPVANGKATAAVPRDGVLRCCRRRSLIPFRRYIAEQRGNIKRQSTVRMMFGGIWMRLVDRDRLQCQEPHRPSRFRLTDDRTVERGREKKRKARDRKVNSWRKVGSGQWWTPRECWGSLSSGSPSTSGWTHVTMAWLLFLCKIYSGYPPFPAMNQSIKVSSLRITGQNSFFIPSWLFS